MFSLCWNCFRDVLIQLHGHLEYGFVLVLNKLATIWVLAHINRAVGYVMCVQIRVMAALMVFCFEQWRGPTVLCCCITGETLLSQRNVGYFCQMPAYTSQQSGARLVTGQSGRQAPSLESQGLWGVFEISENESLIWFEMTHSRGLIM